MNKVNVIGTTGSGKSTFGKALAKAIDGEYIEMDALFWKPNWQNADDEEFFSAVEQALNASPRCVIDGNYSRTTALKWQYCDTVIWLDYSYARSLYQITRRSLARAIDKRELWAGTGNHESFRKLFSSDSIMLWFFKHYRANKTRFAQMMDSTKYPNVRFIRLTSPKAAKVFLDKVRANSHE